MRSALAVLLLLQSACICGQNCADCCSGPGSTTSFVASCRALTSDGGAARDIGVSCSGRSDAGTITTSTGDFLLSATRINCGIAAGGDDCGAIDFTGLDGGALGVTFMGMTGPVFAQELTSSGCTLTVR